jgi:RHS repeat-associated protein
LLLSDGTNSYIYGPGNLPVEQINTSTGAVLYLHHDQQGSTRVLTGLTGAKEATFTYDAYGNTTGTTGTAKTALGYDAQYTSSDTGLIYLRARVYDPATAQFLRVDPAVMATRAPYNYAGDNPFNASDPTGLSSWNPFSESFWTEGNFISESPLNPIPYYEEEIESYENGCGYFASVAHGLEGAIAGAALFAGGEGADEADITVADALKGKVGSITRAPLPPGSPSWADIQQMPISDVRAAAKAGEPGYKTILKLLTEGKYNKP